MNGSEGSHSINGEPTQDAVTVVWRRCGWGQAAGRGGSEKSMDLVVIWRENEQALCCGFIM